jgi:hypothetical protein
LFLNSQETLIADFEFLEQKMTNNNSNNNNSSEYSKKEEFRRYLEKNGVLDALTKVLVGLYEEPERPTHALEYIKRYLGAPANVDIDGLKRENADLKHQVNELKKQQAVFQKQQQQAAAASAETNGPGSS